jgi:hypothetical protein
LAVSAVALNLDTSSLLAPLYPRKRKKSPPAVDGIVGDLETKPIIVLTYESYFDGMYTPIAATD